MTSEKEIVNSAWFFLLLRNVLLDDKINFPGGSKKPYTKSFTPLWREVAFENYCDPLTFMFTHGAVDNPHVEWGAPTDRVKIIKGRQGMFLIRLWSVSLTA